MEIALDLSFFQIDNSQHPLFLIWAVFKSGGWIFFTFWFFYGIFLVRLYRTQNKFEAASNPVLLAIDVPRDNEQSMKAVEQMFVHMHGVEKRHSKWEQYGLGEIQLGYSLEIVSIDGYIQFLIRCPQKFRDIAEAAVYAQYPDAFITQVEDYAIKTNLKFPHPEYDLWGTEFAFTKKDPYPIRSYISFEHSLTQKMVDPMSSIMETLANLLPGEQIWLQWVITPIRSNWTAGGEALVKKIVKAKSEAKKTITDKVIGSTSNVLWDIGQSVLASPVQESKAKAANPDATIMLHLTPGQRLAVESIEAKISKVAFQTKFRFIYIGRKDIFSKKRVMSILGVTRQFSSNNLNGFKNHKRVKTSVDYFKKQREDNRKNKVLRAYKARSQTRGGAKGIVLNVEELASLYHFPSIEVKAPLIRKSDAKRTEPPTSLPTEIPFPGQAFPKVPQTPIVSRPTGYAEQPQREQPTIPTPPDNLPFE